MVKTEQTSLVALLRPVAVLGWPMVLTQLFIMGTGFIDTAMAGHYGAVDLAGVAVGGNFMWPLFFLATGVSMALMPITSQLHGANRVAEVGHQLRQSLWLCLINSVFLIAALQYATHIFLYAGIDAQTAQIAGDYLYGLSWGIPPVIFYISFRYVLEGLGHTRPPMIIAASILPLNALFNYVLIYGKFGFPELGGVGCGYATAMVFWIELAFMLLVLRKPYFRATQFFANFEGPRLQTMGKIFKLGLPIALTVFLEMALFGVITLFIAKIGVTEMAAHSIAGNLNWMTYVIPMAMGNAASIRIGFLIGRDELDAARDTGWAMLKFAIGYALTISVLLVALRYSLVSVYTTDAAVTAVAVVLLLFIAVYQIVDDTQAVLVSALRGYKDTAVPMVISLISYWLLALPLGYALAEGLLGNAPLGVYGYWTGLTLSLAVVAVGAGLRLRYISNNCLRIRQLSATETAVAS
jgi:MATE family multidrug resistance protein